METGEQRGGERITSIRDGEFDKNKHRLPIAQGEIKKGEAVTIVEDAPVLTVKAAASSDYVHGISVTKAHPDNPIKIVSQGKLVSAARLLLVALREGGPTLPNVSVVRVVVMQQLSAAVNYINTPSIKDAEDIDETNRSYRKFASDELAQAFADGYEIASVTVGGNEHVLMTVWTLRPAVVLVQSTDNVLSSQWAAYFDKKVQEQKEAQDHGD